MNKVLKAMFCVTFFSVCTRALGFVLKVYLSRELGSVLLGSYQVSLSIFAVLMTIASSGIPVVLSRNVSYFNGKKDKKTIGSIVSSGLIVTTTLCLIISCIIILCPNLLNLIFTSSASSEIVLILLPALIAGAIYEVFNGALWGQQQFFAISFNEFLEQVIRLIVIIILFNTSFINISATNKTALSLSIACIISTIHIAVLYFKKGGTLSNPKTQLKALLKSSSPITAAKTVSSIVSSMISVLIPIRLMTYGYSSTEALSEYGIMMGMTFPLVMIPSTLIGSLATTIIPSISEQSNNIDNGKLTDKTLIKSKINFAIKLAIVFSSILLSTFIALGKPLCDFIYNNSRAGIFLSVSAIAMIPLGISQITSAILNAVGLEMKSLKTYAISASLLVLSIFILPRYIGTYSLIIGYMLMSISSSIMNLKMLHKRKIVDYEFSKTIFTMLGITLLSSAITISIYNLISQLGLIALFTSILISLSSTILLLFTFNIADIKVFMFGKLKQSQKAKVYSQA